MTRRRTFRKVGLAVGLPLLLLTSDCSAPHQAVAYQGDLYLKVTGEKIGEKVWIREKDPREEGISYQDSRGVVRYVIGDVEIRNVGDTVRLGR